MSKSLNIIFSLALAGAASACATMPTEPPTAAQRASCEEMLKMGEGATHSHSTDKSGIVNTMALTHAQCKRMLKG